MRIYLVTIKVVRKPVTSHKYDTRLSSRPWPLRLKIFSSNSLQPKQIVTSDITEVFSTTVPWDKLFVKSLNTQPITSYIIVHHPLKFTLNNCAEWIWIVAANKQRGHQNWMLRFQNTKKKPNILTIKYKIFHPTAQKLLAWF